MSGLNHDRMRCSGIVGNAERQVWRSWRADALVL
jgi:hypothetical protein